MPNLLQRLAAKADKADLEEALASSDSNRTILKVFHLLSRYQVAYEPSPSERRRNAEQRERRSTKGLRVHDGTG